MAKFVLVADSTLIYTYHDFPLLDFLPSAPKKTVPSGVYNFLKGEHPKYMDNGELLVAPYSIRKLEAKLLEKYPRKDVAVVDGNNAAKFIDANTEVIGVSTMDPFGIGPLTMSYAVLFGGDFYAWVRRDFEILINKLNAARKGKKAKLVVGGPGVWDFTVLKEEFEKMNIDYAVQGETDDVLIDLFEQLTAGQIDKSMFNTGYLTFNDKFQMSSVSDERFISRKSYGHYPPLEKIPAIVRPSIKGMVEVMRGCGVGCDFCEVTLRPLRYQPLDFIKKEIEVNIKSGTTNKAWLHSDEFFGYKHGKFFEPNQEALVDLFTQIKQMPGVKYMNPTHGRIAIPAGFPDLIKRLSEIAQAGPSNWIGLQVGLETGSEELAKKHMPAKTLPLKVGSDGSWHEIVWRGVQTFTKYYWRPAFTVQVGQDGETDDDNWETVALINKLSNSYVDGRPFEFTVTPMVNVPMGRIKSHSLNEDVLKPSMFAVYYAAYRHLRKMALRDARAESKGNPLTRIGTTAAMDIGSGILLNYIGKLAKKSGVDLEKASTYGLSGNKGKMIESVSQIDG
ncbi:radical SAM superfamily enzyme [Candidatus Mancarchaeum acidiphilum]|uniref:Radical SAM superfamily enzyme n=1 Tax=Candidatus Mancarchaeum acidiphilum TaxID=1920749 RepID=A0A218NN63_9ARCH|nr:radical SAM protein [Candidatus Mancarchaeum acidiphilum]ASI13910.1 radical SAM superfamily enzyme [Candidatus Mancarchaeum acidiphilum]